MIIDDPHSIIYLFMYAFFTCYFLGGKSKNGQPLLFLHSTSSKKNMPKDMRKVDSKINVEVMPSSSCVPSTSSVPPRVDPVIYYHHILKEHNAISPIDEEYNTFAVQDIEKGKLKVFIIINSGIHRFIQ